MDVNIQKYMAFVNVVEYGSFSKTAEVMSYSQSGISRMIKDLEKEWGITLLARGKGGVSLTSDGMSMLPYVRSVVEDFERLEQHADSIRGLETGLIRIGTISSVATYILPEVIKKFKADYPMIEFELKVGGYEEINEWVAGGVTDCGFLNADDAGGLECFEVEKDELMAVLPKGHKYEKSPSFPVGKLQDDDFIMIEKEGTHEVADVLKRKGIKVNTKYTTIDDYAAMAMVESGLGISILNGLILERCPFDVVIKKLSRPAYRSIVLALKDREAVSGAVARFLEYI